MELNNNAGEGNATLEDAKNVGKGKKINGIKGGDGRKIEDENICLNLKDRRKPVISDEERERRRQHMIQLRKKAGMYVKEEGDAVCNILHKKVKIDKEKKEERKTTAKNKKLEKMEKMEKIKEENAPTATTAVMATKQKTAKPLKKITIKYYDNVEDDMIKRDIQQLEDAPKDKPKEQKKDAQPPAEVSAEEMWRAKLWGGD